MTDLPIPSDQALRTATFADSPAAADDAFRDDRPARPERAGPDPRRTRRGPRPALLVVAGVVSLAVVALAGWQSMAVGYELAPGALGGGGPDGRRYEKPYVRGVEYEFAMDRSYDLYFSIRNTGPLPVRIEGLEPFGLPLARLAVIPATPSDMACCDTSTAVPFQPTDLPAGGELVLLATFAWDGDSAAPAPDAPCSRVWWSTVRVRRTVLGLTQAVELELPQALILRSPRCTT
ncbi:hypothetical protein [Catellatospora vulcania]|uniref:hypothetical protein n=1 Tax=Catellatospora vulcania TaxID=1460450 RepID=UPI0012D39826|nr:hypothetical protein [Catellatospora vulcania]